MHTLSIFQQMCSLLNLYLVSVLPAHVLRHLGFRGPGILWLLVPSSWNKGSCILVDSSPALNFLDHPLATWGLGIPSGSKPIYRMCTQISAPKHKQVGEPGLYLPTGPQLELQGVQEFYIWTWFPRLLWRYVCQGQKTEWILFYSDKIYDQDLNQDRSGEGLWEDLEAVGEAIIMKGLQGLYVFQQSSMVVTVLLLNFLFPSIKYFLHLCLVVCPRGRGLLCLYILYCYSFFFLNKSFLVTEYRVDFNFLQLTKAYWFHLQVLWFFKFLFILFF